MKSGLLNFTSSLTDLFVFKNLVRNKTNVYLPKNGKLLISKMYLMNTFGEFLRKKRIEKGLNQSEFGHRLGIIMTDISKIENGKKKFPFSSLKLLSTFLDIDFLELKHLYVADKLVEEVHKHDCSDTVFFVAESQSKYLRNKKLGKSKF